MSKNKLVSFIQNMSYTLVSNVISLIISIITILIVPRYVGVETYGYYQLYIFYINYVGVSFIGWCDGIYLREGGKQYDELDKPVYSSQFFCLLTYEILFYTIFFLSSTFIVDEINKRFVVGYTCIAAVAICLRWFIVFIQDKRVCDCKCF